MSNKKLEKVQNTAVRITLKMPRTEHITSLLKMLQWLPISSRIAYKTDYIWHTWLTTAYLKKYLSELLTVYSPARPLCSSSDPNILDVATSRTKSYGQRTLTYQGPSNWNRVRGEVRGSRTHLPLVESSRHPSSISRTKISKLFILFLYYWNL